jgi:hypothetical protein
MTKDWLKPPIELRNGYKDKVRLAAIHNLPCSLCFLKGWKQKTRTTAHHKHGGGLGKKSSDLLAMALCDNCHQKGKFAFHKIGRITWEEKFDVDQDMLIEITNKMLENEN